MAAEPGLTPELITALVGAITGAVGAYVAIRRFGPEQRKNFADVDYTKAQEEKVEAETANSWIETYEKMYGIISERDTDILNLKRDYEELKDEFARYKVDSKSLLDAEKKARKFAENERDGLRERVISLEAASLEQRELIDRLREEMNLIRSQENQNGFNDTNPHSENP